MRDRPHTVFDEGLQHERTALAWERTAISLMVAGILMVRYTSRTLPVGFALAGLAQVVTGAGLLLWSARHYEDLHGPLRAGESPIHPTATRVVGATTVAFTGLGLLLSIAIAVAP